MSDFSICVLDGYTLNPGDLSWDELKKLGSCTIYDRTKPQELVDRLAGFDIAITNKVVLDADKIYKLPDLKCLVVSATGYNVVDVESATLKNITVCNVPAYSTDSVAQLVFSHLLNIAQNVAYHDKTVKQGRWVKSADFSYWETPLIELAGLKLGIIGFGQIGRRVAEIGRSFGMQILLNTPRPIKNNHPDLKQVDLNTLLKESDVISLHCPLTDATKHLINKETLQFMKPSAILINTGRGPLIDENDLADALNKGRISAACLDVLYSEPPGKDNPLLTAKNSVITPHIAWASIAARKRLMDVVTENVKAFISGNAQNVVNPKL
ncbi:MAG: D-2-hydroxyacid dehydrogenase [Calditrichae bacterium]|nr:D-2-hydroxyacid dehydrogenase [Calditrichota bacterium]MCB9059305.1 D-2-hydroxyacid dehydrogenase [Calditrichia bacterium]